MKIFYSLLIVILFSLSIVYGTNSLDLKLDKSVYGPFAELKGMCVLKLDRPLDLGLEPKIKLSISERREERDALDVLKGLDPDLDVQESSVNLGSSSSQKTFDLSTSNLFGIKIPKGSEVTRIDFDIEGISSNGFPNSPFMDFKDDSNYEWYYKGVFSGFSSEVVKAKGLNENGASEDIVIRDNIFLYCSIVNLPYSNKFNVSAKYSVINNAGNISIQIFEFDQESNTAYGKKGDCNLKNSVGVTEGSCVVNASSFLSGENLVCFYNSKNEGSYFLNLDDNGEGSFECDSAILDQEEQCSYLQEGDFFFKVSKPIFQGEFNTAAKFSDYGRENFKDDLTDYLAECQEDDSDDCNIILRMGSENSKGKVRLSNFNLEYSKESGASFVTRKIFDVDFVNAKILGVSGKDFKDVNYTLNIPLEVFDNFTTPNITSNQSTKTVKISLGSLTDQEDISINRNIISSAQSELDSFKLKLESLKNKEELKDFFKYNEIDLEQPIKRMNDFRTSLEAVNSNPGLGIGDKGEEADRIVGQAETYLSTFLKEVTILEDVEYPRVYAEKIRPEILGNEKEENVLAIQEEIDIDSRALVVATETFNGVKSEKTLITRKLSSNLPEYYIFEDIDKSVSDNAGAIKFSSGVSVVKDDPVVKWRINGNGEIGYIIDGNVLSKINEIKTVIVPSQTTETQETEFQESSCGDGICTEILEDELSCPEDCEPKFNVNWSLVIVLIIILILGLLYFNFFMGKERKLREIVVKKYPFLSSTDEANLKAFISKSLGKGIPRATVYKILLQKKWSKEQIDYVFKKVQPPESKLKFIFDLLKKKK